MKKYILLLLFVSSLNADYLLTVTEYVQNWKNEKEVLFSRCITEYVTTDSRLYYRKSSDGILYYKAFDDLKSYTVQSGFYLSDNGGCYKYTGSLKETGVDPTHELNADTLSVLGLSDNQLNFIFALSGIICALLLILAGFKGL